MNTILGSLRLEKHPDKAFIGRIDRGFDFLGYRFTANSLTLAVGTMANFAERVSRFYAQERDGPDGRSRPGAYVRRWWAWASGGLTFVDPRSRGRSIQTRKGRGSIIGAPHLPHAAHGAG